MTTIGSINFIRGGADDFSKLHLSNTTAGDMALTVESSFIPYFAPRASAIPPIAKILNLKARMHIPNTVDGEILGKESIFYSDAHKTRHIEEPNESAFDLGTSSLQRIICQMREMRRSSSKHSYQANNMNTKHNRPDCLPSYQDYLLGNQNTSWEIEKRRKLQEILSRT